MNERNGSTPDITAVPALDDNAEYLDGRLRVLCQKLESRGLEPQLVSYPVNGVKGKHYDAVTVTNPAAPERGMMHVEKDGCITWEFPGRLADDGGMGKIVDEATNALRATGVPYQPRQSP